MVETNHITNDAKYLNAITFSPCVWKFFIFVQFLKKIGGKNVQEENDLLSPKILDLKCEWWDHTLRSSDKQ